VIKISRKTIGFVVAIVGAILLAFQEQFGLSFNPTAVAAGLGAILTYIFFEAKLDLKALKNQPRKWRDPKFWITIISAILAAIEASFHLGIPVEAIVGLLTAIVAGSFGVQLKKDYAPY